MKFFDTILNAVIYVCMIVFVLMCFAPVFCVFAAFLWVFVYIMEHLSCGV